MRHGRKAGDKIWLTGSETFFTAPRAGPDTMNPGGAIRRGESCASYLQVHKRLKRPVSRTLQPTNKLQTLRN